MPNLRQAAQQALEALENAVRYHGIILMSDPPQDAWKYHRVEGNAKQAISAIKEALAQPVQPEQEPPQHSLKAHWTNDKRIGVVACVTRPDGGVHLMQTIIDPPLPVQRCALCNYQHGHQIGCKNNPVDIALANLAQPPTASRRTHEH